MLAWPNVSCTGQGFPALEIFKALHEKVHVKAQQNTHTHKCLAETCWSLLLDKICFERTIWNREIVVETSTCLIYIPGLNLPLAYLLLKGFSNCRLQSTWLFMKLKPISWEQRRKMHGALLKVNLGGRERESKPGCFIQHVISLGILAAGCGA